MSDKESDVASEGRRNMVGALLGPLVDEICRRWCWQMTAGSRILRLEGLRNVDFLEN